MYHQTISSIAKSTNSHTDYTSPHCDLDCEDSNQNDAVAFSAWLQNVEWFRRCHLDKAQTDRVF